MNTIQFNREQKDALDEIEKRLWNKRFSDQKHSGQALSTGDSPQGTGERKNLATPDSNVSLPRNDKVKLSTDGKTFRPYRPYDSSIQLQKDKK